MEAIKIGEIKRSRESEQAYNRIVSTMFMLRERRAMKSFVFTGCARGVGNTTVCIGLASSLAKTGMRTLLVDCDFLKPAEDKRLYQYVDAGLAEYLESGLPLENITYKTDIPNLYYISSGAMAANPTVMFWSEKFTEFINETARNYDFIIFDTAPVLEAPEACVLTYRASAAVMTVRCGKTKKSQIYAAKKEIASMSENLLGVLVNNTPPGEYKIYQKSHGFSAIIRGPREKDSNE